MNRYYTVMIVPEREKGVRSFRVPRLIFRSLAFIVALASILLGIMGYDYYKIQSEVYENKHLILDNKQLKEQIQLFQMKLNSLTDDIRRIHTFEKKLRIITGVEAFNLQGSDDPLKKKVKRQ
jgi:hypothetical protein